MSVYHVANPFSAFSDYIWELKPQKKISLQNTSMAGQKLKAEIAEQNQLSEIKWHYYLYHKQIFAHAC